MASGLIRSMLINRVIGGDFDPVAYSGDQWSSTIHARDGRALKTSCLAAVLRFAALSFCSAIAILPSRRALAFVLSFADWCRSVAR